ncbi:hypothetical protein COP1_026296 [Malus domestica]
MSIFINDLAPLINASTAFSRDKVGGLSPCFQVSKDDLGACQLSISLDSRAIVRQLLMLLFTLIYLVSAFFHIRPPVSLRYLFYWRK